MTYLLTPESARTARSIMSYAMCEQGQALLDGLEINRAAVDAELRVWAELGHSCDDHFHLCVLSEDGRGALVRTALDVEASFENDHPMAVSARGLVSDLVAANPIGSVRRKAALEVAAA